MALLSKEYYYNVEDLKRVLRYRENFDVLHKELAVADKQVSFFYIDGFVKDSELQRVMQYLLSKKDFGSAEDALRTVPYSEVELCRERERLVTAILSGQCAMLSDSFSDEALLLDLRTYPARQTEEPQSDRVMQGARDGFVETLVMNTALLRRRIRDPRLIMRHFDIGGSSHTDIIVSYMDGIANPKIVETICKKITEAKPKSLTQGAQSLSESLVRRRWYNPFPKIRTTERPDTASAQIMEGSILVFCDTSPEVMILPTSIFDFLEEADDYSFPPLTGAYLRIIRIAILLLSVIATPLWYLAVEYGEALPPALAFLIPDEPGALPLILQLVIAELAVDGLKLASMNTPDMLSNSLAVVGALILGDFAVSIGWFSEDVIFYMACVSIANFAQQNYELGYAFKFMRMIILGLVYFLGVWGFAAGILLFILAVGSNVTVTGKHHYLYPLIPFNLRALKRHFIRMQKDDFENNRPD